MKNEFMNSQCDVVMLRRSVYCHCYSLTYLQVGWKTLLDELEKAMKVRE